jgi:hypothetical protein
MEELLEWAVSMRYVSYQRKADDQLFLNFLFVVFIKTSHDLQNQVPSNQAQKLIISNELKMIVRYISVTLYIRLTDRGELREA